MNFLDGFASLPPYAIAAVVVLVLYAVESEMRFGTRARSLSTGTSDRGSTLALSVAAAIPLLGFAVAIKAATISWVPEGFRHASLPGVPETAWAGVALGVVGLALRFWALVTLRERYTRTLFTHEDHAVERGGPYRWIRHPGYLGSILCLNGIAMASANWMVLSASLVATLAAYAHRIRVEDQMLVRRFGETYAAYRREVAALIPFLI